MALRFAHALGLHVRNEDPSSTAPNRESLVRIWWSLYILDRHLSVITGRPSVVVDSFCSVPLPIPLPEEQITDEVHLTGKTRRSSSFVTKASVNTSPTLTGSGPSGGAESLRTTGGFGIIEANSGSFFTSIVQMNIITQDILSSLYTAGTMIRSYGDLHKDIIQLRKRLDHWIISLPSGLNYQNRQTGVGTPSRAFFRERTILGFLFNSARVLLTRPCLGGMGPFGKEAKGPAPNTKAMAISCIDAVKSQLDLIPDQPDPLFIYEYGPWWSIVHHLMQSLAALLLAISSSFFPHDIPAISEYVKKIIRWLRSMQDPLSERAYRIALNAYQTVANKYAIDISELRVQHALAYPNSDVGRDDFSRPGTFGMTDGDVADSEDGTFSSGVTRDFSAYAAMDVTASSPSYAPWSPDAPFYGNPFFH
jgi:hypothetical protein